MIDKKKIEKLCLMPYSFILYNDKDAAQQIVVNMTNHYLRSLGDIKINIIIEGDSLSDKSFSRKVMNRLNEEISEVNPITQAVYDFIIDVYDLEKHKIATFTNEMIISYDKDDKCKVECSNKEYRWHKDPAVDRYSNMDYVNTPISNSSTSDDSISKRFMGLDFDENDVEISDKPKRYRIKKQELINLQNYLGDLRDDYMKIRNKIADDDFIIYDRIMAKSLDEIRDFVDNFPKSDKVLNPPDKVRTRKPRTKTNNPIRDRISSLDYNSLKRERKMSKLKLKRVNEQELQLIQRQDQSLDNIELQNKTAKKKLGKQVQTDTVSISKSVQKAVDEMSFQKAYDALEDAHAKWEDADTIHQYMGTINLASQWYRDNRYFISLVSSFQEIDDLYKASELTRKILDLEKKMASSKSRTEVAKLKKEHDQCRNELNDLNTKFKTTYAVNSESSDILEKQAQELKRKEKEYIMDYRNNISEWQDMFGKLEKLGKSVEIMDALRIKYITNRNDIKAVTPKYKELIDTPIPSIIDIRGLEDVNLDIIYKAWDNTIRDYRRKLEDFNKVFSECYDALAPILAIKAKSRSLF